MHMVTKDHPALKLLADTLSVTSDANAPGLAENIASILGHSLEATGYELVPKREGVLSAAGRVAVLAARSAVADGREVGPNTAATLLIELERLGEEGLLFDHLTPGQREVLRAMLSDWVGEGFTTPPYSEAQYDIFEALGVESAFYDTKRPGRPG